MIFSIQIHLFHYAKSKAPPVDVYYNETEETILTRRHAELMYDAATRRE